MYIENIAEKSGMEFKLGGLAKLDKTVNYLHLYMKHWLGFHQLKTTTFPSIQNTNTISIHTSSGLNNNVFFGDKDITRGTLSIPTYTELVLKVMY